MKKRCGIIASVAIVTIAAVLASCDGAGDAVLTETGGTTAVEPPVSEEVQELYHCKVVNMLNYHDKSQYEAVPISETATVTFNGQSYTGTLYDTRCSGIEPFLRCMYKFERGDGKFGEFETDVDGNLLDWYDNEILLGDTDEPISEEECLQIAKDIFTSQVGDISAYQVNTVTETGFAVDLPNFGQPIAYRFDFMKYVDGIASADHVLIYVTLSGKVYSYASYMLGFIPANTKNPFDMEKADATAIRYIKDHYADLLEKDHVEEFNELWKQFVVLDDGSYGLLYLALDWENTPLLLITE